MIQYSVRGLVILNFGFILTKLQREFEKKEVQRVNIGEKIRRLRMQCGLTQQELADRTELSKGYISQLERETTSPSIATLVDLLEALGTNLSEFFSEKDQETIVFRPDDAFEKSDEILGNCIRWLVPNAQKNAMEPILLTIEPGGRTTEDNPHSGEEFGFVLSGSVVLHMGTQRLRVRRGDSFYFSSDTFHSLENPGKTQAQVLWVSCPPSF